MPKKYVKLEDRAKAAGNYSPIFFFDCLPGEEWRAVTDRSIPDVSPVYYVSNYGRIYTTYYFEPRLKAPSYDEKGYLKSIFWTKNKTKVCRRVHRVEMMEFNYIPGCEKLEINHIDGNKQNDYIGNLEWCTHLENMRHALRTGLEPHIFRTGEENVHSKITDEQADEIGRLLKEQKYTREQIAEIVGCSAAIVCNLSTGADRKYIYDKYDLGNRNKLQSRSIFTFEEIEKICQFFQDNCSEYEDTKTDIVKSAAHILFPDRMINSEEKYKVIDCMRRIYNRKIFKDISSKYIW